MAHQRKVFWSDDDLRRRLRRIEGQVRGIEAMVGRGESCDDILVQLAATKGALSGIVKIVEACRLAEHLVGEHAAGTPEFAEVQQVIRRLSR